MRPPCLRCACVSLSMSSFRLGVSLTLRTHSEVRTDHCKPIAARGQCVHECRSPPPHPRPSAALSESTECWVWQPTIVLIILQLYVQYSRNSYRLSKTDSADSLNTLSRCRRCGWEHVNTSAASARRAKLQTQWRGPSRAGRVSLAASSQGSIGLKEEALFGEGEGARRTSVVGAFAPPRKHSNQCVVGRQRSSQRSQRSTPVSRECAPLQRRV